MKKIVTLTGVKATGMPHVGNYLGAMRPAIERLKNNIENKNEFLYFIPDYHSLISHKDSGFIRNSSYEVAATWLACGLDPQKVIFYRQSDVPQILEMTWILSCFTPKGDLNRAHAYKALTAQNKELGREDEDQGVNAGLFYYPILMAADILLFDTNFVPVGQDQRQHVEMARSIAQRMNHYYKKELLVEPQELIEKDVATVVGLDGRKMSKSYDNSIPLFIDDKTLKKYINKIKTDSTGVNDPKDPETSPIFQIYAAFNKNNLHEIDELRQRFLRGISWGEAKEELLKVMSAELSPLREKYDYYINHKSELDQLLRAGAEKAKLIAQKKIELLRSFVID